MTQEKIKLADWSGFTNFGGETLVYTPKSEEELSSIVRQCYAKRQKLRVVGNQTSWNSWWHNNDVIVSLKNLNSIIDINVEKRLVTCQTGVTLGELHKALWEKGLVLETAPAINWVTIGGAISTGSHGSGSASIGSSLVGCRIVLGNTDGEVTEIWEGDERLDAVRISQGMLGILSSVTLRVVDAFYVKLTQTRIPTEQWTRFLSEGEMSMALWFPHTDSTVLVRVDKIAIPTTQAALEESKYQAKISPDVAKLNSISQYSLPVIELANHVKTTFGACNRYLLDVFYQDQEAVGAAPEMLMSFQSTPIAGAEWSVPVSRFGDALAQLDAEISQGDFYLPAPVFLKKVKPETAWLRAADEDCVQCGIYHAVMRDAPSNVKEMVTRVEKIMLKHRGRPHLGKLIYFSPEEMKQLYPNWEKFNALRQQMDSTGMFWTEAIQRVFGN
jgi:L-gulonolactone oxidase